MKAPSPGTCPTCGKPAPFVPDNPWRPFCSQRCKSIDLGGWASEVYRIPAKDDEDGEPSERDQE